VEVGVEDNPTRHSYPAYMGASGTLFDLNYLPVAKVPVDPATVPADAADVYDVAALAKAQPKPETAAQAYAAGFPEPAQYKSYEEFERALIAWKERVEAELGMAALPTVLGRHYARPKVAGAGGSTGSTGSKHAESSSYADGMIKVAADGGGGEAAEGEKAVEKWLLPLTHDPWEAALVAPEPDPHFYEDIEQYENAMLRWALECCRNTPRMLPHASQLQSLKNLKIQPAKEVFSLASGLGAAAGTDTSTETLQRLGTAKSGYANPHVVYGEWAPRPSGAVQVAQWPAAVTKAKLTASLAAAAMATEGGVPEDVA
jgi:hypothetical protein